jgi:hypothetical protein
VNILLREVGLGIVGAWSTQGEVFRIIISFGFVVTAKRDLLLTAKSRG